MCASASTLCLRGSNQVGHRPYGGYSLRVTGVQLLAELGIGIDVVNAHVMIYPEGYRGNAHFDTRMNTDTPGSLGRLLVPAKGNEGRPIAFYASHKGPRGWPVLRDARGLALATGPILMNDCGSGGSAVVAAGQAELGHKGSAADASDIFLGHAPYPKGKPATARSATVVFTGRERGSGGGKRKR